MKKFALLLIALMACVNTYAFKFDGIDLNAKFNDIVKEVAKKGYVTAPERANTFAGLCQGTKIYLTFVQGETGKLGQLIVEVPNTDATAIVNNAQLLNVIYHQAKNAEKPYTYVVDEDGTTLELQPMEGGYKLVYTTPNNK